MTAVRRKLGHLRPISGSRGAHEAPDVVTGQVVGIDSAVFQRMPSHSERDALLGIHRDGFTRRDPEELWIEHRCTAEKSSAIVDFLEAVTPRTCQQLANPPSTVGGEWAQRLATIRQQLPVALRGVDATGRLHGHTDDDYR